MRVASETEDEGTTPPAGVTLREARSNVYLFQEN